MADEAKTAGGSKVLRYEGHAHQYRAPENQAEHIEELTSFLEGFLGKSQIVWDEIVSDKVHIDVLPFPPTEERPFWTFVTSGMSDMPMIVPPDLESGDEYRYGEIVISLPENWFPLSLLSDFDRHDFTDENYWPIRLIKRLARFPHEYAAWLWMPHTLPNGSPAEPYASNTRMSGAILLPPATWDEENWSFRRSDGATVHFLAVYPLYDEEMTVKLSQGSDVLLELIADADFTEVLDTTRPSLATTSGPQG